MFLINKQTKNYKVKYRIQKIRSKVLLILFKIQMLLKLQSKSQAQTLWLKPKNEKYKVKYIT